MIHFGNDYNETAHPAVLSALAVAGSHAGYGLDEHSARAASLIRNACAAPAADVHFMVGGTQVNTTA
ncbi:threonine aldolase, partial [Corynebacterium phoceense]|nr:threonine aldolase [Corynebacterium phoceense]MCQ9348053.1 threonine aldolase [Corynebacterium phoceense]